MFFLAPLRVPYCLFANMMKVAVLALIVVVASANVAAPVGSALTKVSSAKMVTKVADLSERKVVTVTAAKKAVPVPATPNYTETLKMVGLFALWCVPQIRV